MSIARAFLSFSIACAAVLSGATGAAASNGHHHRRDARQDLVDGLSWRLVGTAARRLGHGRGSASPINDTFYFGAAGGVSGKHQRRAHLAADFRPRPVVDRRTRDRSIDRVIVATGQSPRRRHPRGEGVYKSIDGATWHSVGLEATKHIGQIWIDPHNPD